MIQSQAIAMKVLEEINASLATSVQDFTAQISSLLAATREI